MPELRVTKGAISADFVKLDWRAVGPFPGNVKLLIMKIVAVFAHTPDGPVQVPFELGKLYITDQQFLSDPTHVFLPDAPVSALEIHFGGNAVYDEGSGANAPYENGTNSVMLTFDETPRNEAYSVVLDRETVQPGANGWELSLDIYGWDDLLRIEEHLVHHDVEVERLPLEGSPVPLEWTITDPGALAMRMQFREFDLDGCGAKLELYSAVTDTWPHVTGDALKHNDGWSSWIDGDTIEARVTAPNDCGGFWVHYAQSRAWTMTDRFRARTSGETSVTRDGPFGIQAQGGAIVDTEFDRHWFRTITYGAPAGQKQSAIGRRQGNTPPHLCGSPDEIIEYYTEEVCVENRFEVVVPYGEDDCRYSVFEGLDGFEFTGDGGVVRRVDFRGTCAAPVRHGRMTGAQDPTDGFGPVPVPDTDPCVRTEELVLSPECGRAAAEAYLGDAVADTDCDGLSDFVERCVIGTCWDPARSCSGEYTAGAQYTAGPHDTDGDGWWDGWEVCGLTNLQPGDGRAIAASVFAGPAVRDLLFEVIVADDTWGESAARERAHVTKTFQEAQLVLGTRPDAPFGDWSPLSYGIANIVQYTGITASTRSEAMEDNVDYALASDSQIVPLLWSQYMPENAKDNPWSFYADPFFEVDDQGFPGVYLLPGQFEAGPLIHEGGHALCLGHDIPAPGVAESLNTRNNSPVYGSTMNYAQGYRLESDVSVRFSEGGRQIDLESQLTERDVLNSDLSRAQYLSAFWNESGLPLLADPTDAGGNIVNDCTLPNVTCPGGYGCVRNLPAHPHYTGPAAHAPAVGECRAITPHLDWNGNGKLDDGVVTHRAPDDSTVHGWSSDVDCDVSDFIDGVGAGVNQPRDWQFRAELQTCTWGEESPEPESATSDPFGIPTTAEFCQTGRLDRNSGITFTVVDGEERRTYQQINVPFPPPNAAVERCYWLRAEHQFFEDQPYEDRNDFDEIQFRWQTEAPVCSGALEDMAFEPGLSTCVPTSYTCPQPGG